MLYVHEPGTQWAPGLSRERYNVDKVQSAKNEKNYDRIKTSNWKALSTMDVTDIIGSPEKVLSGVITSSVRQQGSERLPCEKDLWWHGTGTAMLGVRVGCKDHVSELMESFTMPTR